MSGNRPPFHMKVTWGHLMGLPCPSRSLGVRDTDLGRPGYPSWSALPLAQSFGPGPNLIWDWLSVPHMATPLPHLEVGLRVHLPSQKQPDGEGTTGPSGVTLCPWPGKEAPTSGPGDVLAEMELFGVTWTRGLWDQGPGRPRPGDGSAGFTVSGHNGPTLPGPPGKDRWKVGGPFGDGWEGLLVSRLGGPLMAWEILQVPTAPRTALEWGLPPPLPATAC